MCDEPWEKSVNEEKMQSKALKRWQKRRKQKSCFWALSRFHVKEVSFIKFFIKKSWFGWWLHTITTTKIQIIHEESHSFMKSCVIRHTYNIHYSVDIIHSSGSWTTTSWAFTLCCRRFTPSVFVRPFKAALEGKNRAADSALSNEHVAVEHPGPKHLVMSCCEHRGRPDYDRQVN